MLYSRIHWSNVDLESLARRGNIAAHDAAYLDLALRSDLALATSDESLAAGGDCRGHSADRLAESKRVKLRLCDSIPSIKCKKGAVHT